MPKNDLQTDGIDWGLTTWEGSRREQLRRWAALPLERVIMAIEEMQDMSDQFGPTRETGAIPDARSAQTAATLIEARAVRQAPAQYRPDDEPHEAVKSAGTPGPRDPMAGTPQTPGLTPPDENGR